MKHMMFFISLVSIVLALCSFFIALDTVTLFIRIILGLMVVWSISNSISFMYLVNDYEKYLVYGLMDREYVKYNPIDLVFYLMCFVVSLFPLFAAIYLGIFLGIVGSFSWTLGFAVHIYKQIVLKKHYELYHRRMSYFT